MSDSTTPVILSAVRTPIGRYLGGLSSFSAPQLGAMVIRDAVARAKVDPAAVDEVIMGQVVQGGSGQAPGPAGPHPGRASRGHSGTHDQQGVRIGAQGGHACLAGDQGRRCRMRRGRRAGVDVERAALRVRHAQRDQGRQPDDGRRHDPRRALGFVRLLPHGRVRRVHRGKGRREPRQTRTRLPWTATARRWRPPRRASSRRKSSGAGARQGRSHHHRGRRVPRKDTTAETLARLKPAFKKDGGTVTAGNAPGLNDGSSALVVASLAFAKAHGLAPLARVTGYAVAGGEPREMFFAPVARGPKPDGQDRHHASATTISSKPTRRSPYRRWPTAVSSGGTGRGST